MPSLEVMQVVEETSTMECDDDDRTVEMPEEADSASTTTESAKNGKQEPSPSKEADRPSVMTASNKKRRVTPSGEDSSSKKKQQRKVNQLTLGDFFFGGKKPTSSPESKSTASPEAKTAINGKKRKQQTLQRTQKGDSTKLDAKAEDSKAASEPEARTPNPKYKGKPAGASPMAPSESKKGKEKSESEESSDADDKVQITENTELANQTEKETDTDAASNNASAVENIAPKRNSTPLKTSTAGPPNVEKPEKESPTEEKPDKDSTPLQTSNKSSPGNPSVPTDKDDSSEPIVIDCTEETTKESDPFEGLPEERKSLLQKHHDMKTRYSRRAEELVVETRGGLNEEDFTMPNPQPLEEETSSDQEFPDKVVANMALLIEGRSLPLSKLVARVCEKLEDCHKRQWPTEAVNTKIKLLAKRKSYLTVSSAAKSVDIFENEDEDRLWRWEFLILDLLPSEILPKVRQARSARKKLSSHHTATMKLLQSLRDAESVIRDLKLPKLDTILAKISRDEEKVLKFEREAEKQRLAEQFKKMKEQEMESKRQEKEQLADEKRKEKERKKQEAENKKVELEKKKQEAEQAREEAKRKKIEEREMREEEKKQEEEQKKQKLKKQKACLLSFFAAPKKKKSKSVHESADDSAKSDQAAETTAATESSDAFDVDVFSKINSLDSHVGCRSLFETLSSDAIACRKRRTHKVVVSIHVTVMPDENAAFGAQPFSELKVIKIPNKYRFLGFHEDSRPAYHGTWSKKSSIVTGRSPFGKDPSHLDYDYDSEAEWEEGDDEMGEDVEDEAKNQEEDMEDEEGDSRIYDYDDGFCVADERYLDIDENVDEETKVLYKKKLKSGQNGDSQAVIANRVSIIAPVFGGIPLEGSDNSTTNLIEGFKKQEGLDLLSSHQGIKLLDFNLCLDAFRPALVDEVEVTKDTGTPSGGNAGKDEYSIEEMRSLARFVHHCTLNSKEKVIEELRNARPSVFSSRAKATRKLDSIAVKKRCTNATGVYWEVKKEVLEELGLQDLLAKKLEGEDGDSKGDATKKKDASTKGAKKASKPQSAKKGKKRKSPEPKPSDKSLKVKSDPKASSEKGSKKSSVAMADSANLLSSFLIKPKKKNPQEQSPKEEVAVAPVK